MVHKSIKLVQIDGKLPNLALMRLSSYYKEKGYQVDFTRSVNKDLFVAIVGTLVSSLGMVVYTIIGQQPDEVNKLQKKNESLSSINNQMETRNDQLEQMIIDMQKEMIEKLTELKSIKK